MDTSPSIGMATSTGINNIHTQEKEHFGPPSFAPTTKKHTSQDQQNQRQDEEQQQQQQQEEEEQEEEEEEEEQQQEEEEDKRHCDRALVPVHSNLSFQLLQHGDDSLW
jgi:hypothetical protein